MKSTNHYSITRISQSCYFVKLIPLIAFFHTNESLSFNNLWLYWHGVNRFHSMVRWSELPIILSSFWYSSQRCTTESKRASSCRLNIKCKSLVACFIYSTQFGGIHSVQDQGVRHWQFLESTVSNTFSSSEHPFWAKLSYAFNTCNASRLNSSIFYFLLSIDKKWW